MPLKLTLDALEVLDAIDRKGSFAAAAGALYRVPSAVTYSMQKLEEDLGVTLFQREGRKAVLTPAGHTLLNQGRELLEAAARLTEATQQVHRGWESRFTIAIDTILCSSTIYPLLQQFFALQPQVEIHLIEEVLGGSWESIIEKRADLVIGCDQPPLKASGLTSKKIMTAEWVFAVNKNHPLVAHYQTTQAPVTEDDIEPYRAVIVRDSSRNLPPLNRRIFERQCVIKVTSMQEKINCQLAGLGVGFLPTHRIQDQLANGQLIALPFEQASPNTDMYIGWKRGNKGRALRWFAERLEALFHNR